MVEQTSEKSEWLSALEALGDVLRVHMNTVHTQMWEAVRGREFGMAVVLSHYADHVERQAGKDAVEDIKAILQEDENEEWDDMHKIKQQGLVTLNEGSALGMPGILVAVLTTYGKLAADDFKAYVWASRESGLSFDRATKLWSIESPEGLNLEGLKAKLSVVGLSVELDSRLKPDFIARIGKTPGKGVARNHVVIEAQVNDDPLSAPLFPWRFVINFPYHKGLVDLFSNKSGMLSSITEYDVDKKCRITFDLDLVEEIIAKVPAHAAGWGVREINVDTARKERQHVLEVLRAPIPEIEQIIRSGEQFRPFQNQAVRFLDHTKGEALLGLDTGLGKTIITLGWLAKGQHRAIVIGPKVVRRNWIKQAQWWFPSYYDEASCVEIVAGMKISTIPDWVKLISVNYEGVKKVWEAAVASGMSVMVIDESHMICRDKSARTKFLVEKARTMQHHILLSGTAVRNSRIDLFTQLQIVNPLLYQYKHQLAGDTIGGTWNKIKSNYISMRKTDVLKDLPPLTTSIVSFQIEGLPDYYDGMQIDEMARLKAELACAKADTTAEFAQEILDTSDSCILIFSDGRDATERIADLLRRKADHEDRIVLHHGEMSDSKRERAKEFFQDENGGARAFVTTRQSIPAGADLYKADVVIFNDLPWVPADIRQATDRAHRIGTTRPVTSYWITAENSVFDARVTEIIRAKFEIAKKVSEGRQVTPEERKWMNTPLSREDILEERQH